MIAYYIIAPMVRPAIRVGKWVLTAYRNATSTVNPRLILIVAHPRSGTTAVATLLAKHCGLRAFTQTGPWTRADADIVTGRRTMAEVIARNRYPFSLDIMSAADAGSFLPQMKAALPEMRVVFLLRDPRDVICSVLERINKGDTSTIVVSDLDYRYLQTDWLGIIEQDPIRKLALRWNKWLELAKSADGVLFRRYEDFLEDKRKFISDLADHLGLPSRFDISGEMDRQMSKHGGDIRIRGAGRWEEMLPTATARLIEATCRDGMLAFGYLADERASSGRADDTPG